MESPRSFLETHFRLRTRTSNSPEQSAILLQILSNSDTLITNGGVPPYGNSSLPATHTHLLNITLLQCSLSHSYQQHKISILSSNTIPIKECYSFIFCSPLSNPPTATALPYCRGGRDGLCLPPLVRVTWSAGDVAQRQRGRSTR